MALFSNPRDTENVPVTDPDDGATYSVTVKRSPDYGDQVFVNNRSVVVGMEGGSEAVKMQVGEADLAMLITTIIDWDFTEDGKKLKVSEANIRRLHPAVAKQIQAAVQPKFRALDEEEKK